MFSIRAKIAKYRRLEENTKQLAKEKAADKKAKVDRKMAHKLILDAQTDRLPVTPPRPPRRHTWADKAAKYDYMMRPLHLSRTDADIHLEQSLNQLESELRGE